MSEAAAVNCKNSRLMVPNVCQNQQVVAAVVVAANDGPTESVASIRPGVYVVDAPVLCSVCRKIEPRVYQAQCNSYN